MIVYREQRRRVSTSEVLRRIGEARGFEREMEMGELHAGIADAYCPDCDRDIGNTVLPPEIEISVPEGFAYYALDPELYRIAARRFRDEARPERVAVIGIRSIGTTLGAIVASELGGTIVDGAPARTSMGPADSRRVRRRPFVAGVDGSFRDCRRGSGAERVVVRFGRRVSRRTRYCRTNGWCFCRVGIPI